MNQLQLIEVLLGMKAKSEAEIVCKLKILLYLRPLC